MSREIHALFITSESFDFSFPIQLATRSNDFFHSFFRRVELSSACGARSRRSFFALILAETFGDSRVPSENAPFSHSARRSRPVSYYKKNHNFHAKSPCDNDIRLYCINRHRRRDRARISRSIDRSIGKHGSDTVPNAKYVLNRASSPQISLTTKYPVMLVPMSHSSGRKHARACSRIKILIAARCLIMGHTLMPHFCLLF